MTFTTSQSYIELCPNALFWVSVASMQMKRSEAGQGGGWGCGPEQLAATVPYAYGGCIAMARRTQPLAVFCKYSITHGSPGALCLNIII